MSDHNDFSKETILKKVGSIHQVCGIRCVEYCGGNENLTKAFLVNNGSGLDFSVNENKCLDIFDMRFKGINLGFQSKSGLNSPYLVDNRESFYTSSQGCGMLYTAGLANVGAGTKEKDPQYYHGNIKNRGAENISVLSAWTDDGYSLKVSGEVRESAFFGRNLLLKREVSTAFGKNSITIKDEIENQDFKPDDVMLLYHLNLGFPLLDSGCEFITPAAKVEPLGNYAAENIDRYTEITEPIDGENECVYAINTYGDKNGNTISMLHNPKLGLAVYVRYSAIELPFMIEWKSMKSGDYAFGMLPSNCRPVGREQALKQGDTKTLKSFEKWQVSIEIGVTDNQDEINSLREEIATLK